jgi:hypothetical protein
LKKNGGAYLPEASPLKVTSNEYLYPNPPLDVNKKKVPGVMGGQAATVLVVKAFALDPD